jgi:hypothetical protein
LTGQGAATERSLQSFFDAVRTNQRANSETFPDWTSIIERIDSCLVRAGEGLRDPRPLMSRVLLNRCQYAFKTTAGMALAGQVVEAFVMQRSVLEYAGYALLICKSPELESVFVLRHHSPKEKQRQKDAFKIGPVKVAIRQCDTKLADEFVRLYERSIDFGAHPNPNAVFSAMVSLDEGEMTMALFNEPKILVNTFITTGEVGLTALHVLRYAFGAEFEQAGIEREMEEIANSGNALIAALRPGH